MATGPVPIPDKNCVPITAPLELVRLIAPSRWPGSVGVKLYVTVQVAFAEYAVPIAHALAAVLPLTYL
jgi:hypothetical protein